MQQIRPLVLLVLLVTAACAACANAPQPVVVIPPVTPEPLPAPPPLQPLPAPPPRQVAAPEPAAPPAPAAPAVPAQAVATSGSSWRTLFRDNRKARTQPRARPLLITEIQGLESLFAATHPSSPDRPKLARRLADEYVELEASAEQSLPQGGAQAVQASLIASAARGAATKYYQLLESAYPGFCVVPGQGSQGSGCLDEALYYEGAVMERAGDYGGARLAYMSLGPLHTQLTAATLVAFADMFFEEAQQDPTKLPLAKGSYEEALKNPAGPIDILGYAFYQLGRTLKRMNGANDPSARDALQHALAWTRAHQSAPGAAELADAVRRE